MPEDNIAPEVIYTVGLLVHRDNALTVIGYINGPVEYGIVVESGSTVTVMRSDIAEW